MFLNYLKLSFRLLARNPFFAGINIVGLAVGFTAFYALWQYSASELKSDQYHKDAERIARINVQWQWLEESTNVWGHLVFGFTKTSLFPSVSEDFPEVESTLRILNQGEFNFASEIINHDNRITISMDDPVGRTKIFKEEYVAYADTNLFSFFSIPLIYGQPENVLSEANFVALSQSTALKYFGKENPLGKLLLLNNTIPLKVSGVYEDLPHHTHLKFDLVISNLGLLSQPKVNSAYWDGTSCYVKLRDKNFKEFETKLNQKAEIYWASLWNIPNRKLQMFVQPLTEISFERVANLSYVKSRPLLITLGFIALSILTMAWVNYVNLSVTRITGRFKEIATRKVSGAGASDILGRFITEAMVTNGLALALSLTLIQIVRTPAALLFNIYFEVPASLSMSSMLIFLFVILAGALVTGLYPALISVSQKSRELFKKESVSSARRTIPALLTVAQLTVATVFIMLAFTVFLQLDHILNKDVGIKTEQVIVIEAPVTKPDNYNTILNSLKRELLTLSDVPSVSFSSHLVTDIGEIGFNVKRIGSDEAFGMDSNGVDEDYIPFFGFKIIAGRNFLPNDRSNGIIVTRFVTDRLGYATPESAIGSRINYSIYAGEDGWQEAEIIGVIDNFRKVPFFEDGSYSQITNEGRGTVLSYGDQLSLYAFKPEVINVRILPNHFKETIATIENLCKREFPLMVFSWSFLDDKLNAVYAEEKIARNQIILFTTLALLIACLGLLGMITNKVVEKTKEIGIRKVLGAQLHQIAQILLDTTAKQIFIASAIGIPAAWYFTQQYLHKFSERITLQWWHYALPVMALLLIILATVATVVWKASRTNPIEALKYE